MLHVPDHRIAKTRLDIDKHHGPLVCDADALQCAEHVNYVCRRRSGVDLILQRALE